MTRWLLRLYGWAAERLYYELAWAYDLVAWVVSLGRWSAWRLTALDHVVGDRVLEVGFGTGALLIEMKRRGLAAWGLDLSPAMHRVTARKMARHGVWTPRVCGRTQAMPYASGSFDTIVSTFPAAYIVDPGTMREVGRLLVRPGTTAHTPGGRLVIVGVCVTTESSLLRRLLRPVYGGPADDILPIIERVAAPAGLKVIEVRREGGIVQAPAYIVTHRAGSG